MSGELTGIGMVICFSISFVIIRRIESETTPLFNNALRSIIGSLSFVLISAAIGSLSSIFLLPVDLWILLCLSIFCNLVVGDTLYLYSQRAIGPSYAAAITTTFPIFTLLIEFFILKREIGWIMPVAAIITGIGVIIVMHYSENQFKEERTNTSTLKGIVFAFGTSLIWAVGTILTDYSLKQSEQILNLGANSTFVAYSIRYSFAAIIMSTWFGFDHFKLTKSGKSQPEKHKSKKSYKTWLLAIISAVLATTLGSYFNGETARIAGASFLGIMTTSLPLMIIPLNYFINKEKISLTGSIGILIIFAGVLLLFIF